MHSAQQLSNEIHLSDDIDVHAQWIIDHFYKNPMPDVRCKKGNIERPIHGGQHVTRAAIYIPILANLYRKHGDEDALKLTSEDIKLLQIAALFHDSARENEEEDLWDKESATNCYYYLTKELGVPQKKAKMLAEASANKDLHNNAFYELQLNHDTVTWKEKKTSRRYQKNIYQKLIHDADSFEIKRARDKFDHEYLDFWKNIAKFSDEAFDDMRLIALEANGLIIEQGDEYGKLDLAKKEKYEHAKNCYRAVLADIHLFPTLETLYANGHLSVVNFTPYNPEKNLTSENLWAALKEGKVCSRGVFNPSYLYKAQHQTTRLEEEIYKLARRKGVPTRTKKVDNVGKHGNPNRSIAVIGWGIPTFSNSGFLIIDPDPNNIIEISHIDSDSGWGKKAGFTHKKHKISLEQKKKEYQTLIDNMKKGGSARHYQNVGASAQHNEMIYNLDKVHAIFYTHDKVLSLAFNPNHPNHRSTPILEAIFIQQAYQNQLGKENKEALLPIFEYTIKGKKPTQYTHDEAKVLKLWEELISDCFQKQFENKNNIYNFMYIYSTNEIKTLASYGELKDKDTNLDKYYDPALKLKINEMIEKTRKDFNEKFRKEFIADYKTYNSIKSNDDKGIKLQGMIQKYGYIGCFSFFNEIKDDIFYTNILQHLFSRFENHSNYSTNKAADGATLASIYDLLSKNSDTLAQACLYQVNTWIEKNTDFVWKGCFEGLTLGHAHAEDNIKLLLQFLELLKSLPVDKLYDQYLEATMKELLSVLNEKFANDTWDKWSFAINVSRILEKLKANYPLVEIDKIQALLREKITAILEKDPKQSVNVYDVSSICKHLSIDKEKYVTTFLLNQIENRSISFEGNILSEENIIDILNSTDPKFLTDDVYAQLITKLFIWKNSVYHFTSVAEMSSAILAVLEHRKMLNKDDGSIPENIQRAIADSLSQTGIIAWHSYIHGSRISDKDAIPTYKLKDEIKIYKDTFPFLRPPNELLDAFRIAIIQLEEKAYPQQEIQECKDLYIHFLKKYNLYSVEKFDERDFSNISLPYFNFNKFYIARSHQTHPNHEPIVLDLSNCCFNYAELQHANLGGLILKGTSFRSADLSHTSLEDTNLSNADFKDAKLYDVEINSNTDFKNAKNLEYADFIPEFSEKVLTKELEFWKKQTANHPQSSLLQKAIAMNICRYADKAIQAMDQQQIEQAKELLTKAIDHDLFDFKQGKTITKKLNLFYQSVSSKTAPALNPQGRQLLVDKLKQVDVIHTKSQTQQPH